MTVQEIIKNPKYDAVVVGAGPNGLAAAIVLGRAGLRVLVVEGHETPGGGTRTQEVTLSGFRHDVCATIHGMAAVSPFLRSLELEKDGVEWLYSPAALAHPLDDRPPLLLHRSVEMTAAGLGRDAAPYIRTYGYLAENWQAIFEEFLGPFPFPPHHPLLMARFSIDALQPAWGFACRTFQTREARALFAGLAGHAILPLQRAGTTAFGLLLGLTAHAAGWPVAKGGSQAIADALVRKVEASGGKIETGRWVRSLDELPPSRLTLLDVTPRQFIQLAGEKLPGAYRRALERFPYGPGVFKIDYALNGPIPWKNQECSQAATVHLGGTLEEIAASEQQVWRGEHPERPYVLFAQQSLVDDSRAPQGCHTAWAYCHVPNGSTVDMTARIEAQIERFAPGFRDCILARSTRNTMEMEAYSPNYVGGDINGGVQDLLHQFTRPLPRWVPYSTPLKGVYLCSSSTPPGGGVHGMAGMHAARAALKSLR